MRWDAKDADEKVKDLPMSSVSRKRDRARKVSFRFAPEALHNKPSREPNFWLASFR